MISTDLLSRVSSPVNRKQLRSEMNCLFLRAECTHLRNLEIYQVASSSILKQRRWEIREARRELTSLLRIKGIVRSRCFQCTRHLINDIVIRGKLEPSILSWQDTSRVLRRRRRRQSMRIERSNQATRSTNRVLIIWHTMGHRIHFQMIWIQKKMTASHWRVTGWSKEQRRRTIFQVTRSQRAQICQKIVLT